MFFPLLHTWSGRLSSSFPYQILGATTFTFDAAGRSLSGDGRQSLNREQREEARQSHFKKRPLMESVNTKQMEKAGVDPESV